MPRFVVLYHEMPPDSARPSHWDVMFEDGDVLKTWALADAPRVPATIAAEALPDHRLAYLDYEGPISRNRGTVTCWDKGEYVLGRRADDHFEAEIRGLRIAAVVAIALDPRDQCWSASVLSTNES